MRNADQDKAGQRYWNKTWDAIPLPTLWPVDSKKIRDGVERALFKDMANAFKKYGFVDQDKTLVEVGCARSAVLPLFAKKLGFRISGIDYSPNGCDQTRHVLERERVQGEIYCCDIFSPPNNLIEKFDVVVSFGLIEHFSDTTEIVSSLSRLVKPGGLVFTSLPNMNGTIGFAQKILDRGVYDIHVPLTSDMVRIAHEQAGLQVISCNYFLSTNFGVVNLNSVQLNSIEWWIKKITLAFLARMSMGVWLWERMFGPLPASHTFSPYINCIAMKPR